MVNLTEIGKFPEDWEIEKLGCKSDIYRGGSPRPIQAFLTTSTHGVNWIKIGDVAPNAKYITATDEKIIPEGAYRSRSVQKGDFILSNSMSFGRPYILKIDGCIHDGWLVIQNYEMNFEQEYLYYFLCSDITTQQYISMAAGSSVRNLSKDKVKDVQIAIPSRPEQQRITAALSDTDAYITALEKLITKKRLIKQGAMQELLIGKRRLPGFYEKWKGFNLIENSTLKARIGWQGLTTAEYLDDGYAYLITGTDFARGKIAWEGCHFVDKNRYDQDPNIQVRNGDVLITKDGTIGKVAIVKDLFRKAALNSGVFVVRPKNYACDSVYLYYVLLSEIFKDFLTKLAAGSTINHLYQKDFKSFEFTLPPTKDEQIAIATILSDMDIEIDALTAKLEKIRNIKKGMMSELLTGRIRLIEVEQEKMKPAIITMPKPTPTQKSGHNQQFDDAVMIAGIVNAFYSDKFRLGRKKVQKLLYFLRRYQDESTVAFKKKAAGPYADVVRYKGGEPIARSNGYVVTTTSDKGSMFAKGKNMSLALDYIQRWGKQNDIQWLLDNFLYKSSDDLELLSTVDMAICDLTGAGISVSVESIKHLIATNKEWRAKLNRQVFEDRKIAQAIRDLETLL